MVHDVQHKYRGNVSMDPGTVFCLYVPLALLPPRPEQINELFKALIHVGHDTVSAAISRASFWGVSP